MSGPLDQKLYDHVAQTFDVNLLDSEIRDLRDVAVEPSLLTADQIGQWAELWWKSKEWKEEQLPQYAPDIAQLLRGVADMIDEGTERILKKGVPSENAHIDSEADL